jgi:glycosyltransferase involved in cell wall biosynthesis
LRITYLITDAYVGGGVVRTVFNTAEELAKRHTVQIVGVTRHRNEPKFPLPTNVTVRTLVDRRTIGERPRRSITAPLAKRSSIMIHKADVRYPKFSLETDLHLMAFLRTVRTDVLIGTRQGLNIAIARWAPKRLVRIGQDHFFVQRYSQRLKDAIGQHYGRLDAVVSLTSSDADDYADLLDHRVRTVAIPNGVPVTGVPTAELQAPVLVAAGRLAHQKGFDRLLDVWARVSPQRPEWELRLFGNGPDHGALTNQISGSGMQSSARLMGFSDKLSDDLAAGSIFAMSSRFEGFPMTLIEAMAAGLPVVCYDCPTGPRDIVTDGVNGYLVSDGDSDQYADRIVRLIDDINQRKAFGRAAVATAAQLDIVHVAARWEGLLEELAAAKK